MDLTKGQLATLNKKFESRRTIHVQFPRTITSVDELMVEPWLGNAKLIRAMIENGEHPAPFIINCGLSPFLFKAPPKVGTFYEKTKGKDGKVWVLSLFADDVAIALAMLDGPLVNQQVKKVIDQWDGCDNATSKGNLAFLLLHSKVFSDEERERGFSLLQ